MAGKFNIRRHALGATLDPKGLMLRFLFPRLTPAQQRGQPLFDKAVSHARQRHWYVEGGIADSLDGRFTMLATVCAMISVRLEMLPEQGPEQSAALTERFVEAMDAEHRQMGMNDPALGRSVRKMVGSLARRVGEWRVAVSDAARWEDVVRSSVYGTGAPSDTQLAHSSAKLRELWQRLASSSDADIVKGVY
ncbi:MAG: ubiquinol-cytochrome C chaperone family protein [Pseudomonadota bacterium]|nr:ubiquinol-cytochrome C chaperone family protein [Sphingomonas sp.]MDQ3477962.1 ubiquinol-cytochrome C chaperone family protein [Pseudomonadota bacterium]